AIVCPPNDPKVYGCEPSKTSTSYNNRFYGNTMGVAPDGTKKPNGTDFWWDSFAGNTGNCWYDNTGADGKKVTTSPSPLPNCNDGKDPESSSGTGAPDNEAELLRCAGAFETGSYDPSLCPWFDTPSKP